MCRLLRNYSIYFAWVIALIATMITLYLSVIRGMPVCELCWYQRVCIYPLIVILGIAAYRIDCGIVKYTMPLSIIGFLFALYQYLYLEQMIPKFAPLHLCGVNGPDCSDIHLQFWGFVTYPFLGMVATFLITFFLITAVCCRAKT